MSHAEKISVESEDEEAQPQYFLNHVIKDITVGESHP